MLLKLPALLQSPKSLSRLFLLHGLVSLKIKRLK
jgi:hypothetical protein